MQWLISLFSQTRWQFLIACLFSICCCVGATLKSLKLDYSRDLQSLIKSQKLSKFFWVTWHSLEYETKGLNFCFESLQDLTSILVKSHNYKLGGTIVLTNNWYVLSLKLIKVMFNYLLSIIYDIKYILFCPQGPDIPKLESNKVGRPFKRPSI